MAAAAVWQSSEETSDMDLEILWKIGSVIWKTIALALEDVISIAELF